jgi:hypothetical protein
MCSYTQDMAKQKVLLTERALIQRLNRKLKPEGRQLRTSRTDRMISTVGRVYAIDTQRNCIDSQDVDIAAWGRELGVLADWEDLEG